MAENGSEGQWVRDLRVKPKTIQLLGENIEDSSEFLGRTQDTQTIKEKKVTDFYFIKIKHFWFFLKDIKTIKLKPQSGKKYLENTYLISDLYPKNITSP